MIGKDRKESIGGIISSIIQEEKVTYAEIQEATDVGAHTIKSWKYHATMPWLKMERVLNHLGYDLEIIKR